MMEPITSYDFKCLALTTPSYIALLTVVNSYRTIKMVAGGGV